MRRFQNDRDNQRHHQVSLDFERNISKLWKSPDTSKLRQWSYMSFRWGATLPPPRALQTPGAAKSASRLSPRLGLALTRTGKSTTKRSWCGRSASGRGLSGPSTRDITTDPSLSRHSTSSNPARNRFRHSEMKSGYSKEPGNGVKECSVVGN